MVRRLSLSSSFFATPLLLATAGAVTGCLSGQIGGEVGNNDDLAGSEGDRCDEEESEVDPSEVTDLGFSVQDLMGIVEGTHSAPLLWKKVDWEGVEVTPSEASTTSIEIQVAPLAETARLVTREVKPRSSSDSGLLIEIDEAGNACPDALRVDAEVTIVTDNGALDDTFTTTFWSEDGKIANARIDLAAVDLDGSLEVDVSQLEKAKLNGMGLSLSIAFGKISGELVGYVEQNHGDAVSQGPLDLAEFPGGESACNSGVPIGDSEWSAAIEDALDAHTEFQFSWQGEDSVGLSIEALELGEFCYESEVDEGLAYLRTTGSFAVKLEDGSIDGTWPLAVSAQIERGELVEVHVLRDNYLGARFSSADFESATGIAGVEQSDAEELTYSFGYIVHVEEELAASGEITLMEAIVPDCSRPGYEAPVEENEGGGRSSPGCSGVDFNEFQNGTFHD